MESNRIITKLFTRSGRLSAPVYFDQEGYKWKISLEFSEVHKVPAIDFKLQCFDIPEGTFLWMTFQIFNVSNGITYDFDLVFDRQRDSFCYRRIVTGIRHFRKEDGKAIVSFPADRFLKENEINEIYEASEQKKWPIYAPFEWKILTDGSVETNPCKICHHNFDYGIALKHIFTFDSPPPRNIPKWPKSQRHQVQIAFFQPAWFEVWTGMAILKSKRTSTKEFMEIYDIFGAVYHQWKFDEDRLMELNEKAIDLGFNSFMDCVGMKWDFLNAISSEKAANIVRKFNKMNLKDEDKIASWYQKDWNFTRKPEIFQTPITVWIALKDNMKWVINFFQSTFRHKQCISIGAVLVGETGGYHYECIMEVSLFSENDELIIKRRARRTLNKNQNSICMPVFCSKQDLDLKGIPDEVKFQVKFGIRKVEKMKEIGDVNMEMPGVNDVILKLDGKCVAVNRHFLAHTAPFFSGLFFNKNFGQEGKKEIEIHTAGFKEMIHFLDTLYHGTKVFHVSQYYHILRLSDEWLSEKVTQTVEKAVKNTKCKCVNKKKLERKFSLKIFPKEETETENKKREADDQKENSCDVKKLRIEN